MGQDVHQVELQNKDMQVASVNQKLLLKELQSFMESLSLPSYVVKVLKEESLDQADGVNECGLAFGQIMQLLNRDFKGIYFLLNNRNERYGCCKGTKGLLQKYCTAVYQETFRSFGIILQNTGTLQVLRIE